MVLLLLLVGMTSIQAQAPWVRFTTARPRVTVPINTTNSVVITNAVDVSTNITGPVTFSVSDLPAGAGVTLTDTNGYALPSTTIDTNLWLTLSTTNIAEGVYTFYLNAGGGATNRLPFVLQAAHVWNGANGALEVPNLLWSAASNWFGGVPGAANDVVFGDIGAQTNFTDGGLSFTNSVVDVNTEISSLRFCQTGQTNAVATDTNLPPRYHHIKINPGVTLTVSGTKGFSMLSDYFKERQGLGRLEVTFSGGAGSKLVVSNQTANFAFLTDTDNSDVSVLNLTNLPTFVAEVNRMGIGEYQIYPNYRGLNDGINGGNETNEYVAWPRRFPADVLLARTNIIKALYVNPDNYANENTRGYAISQFNAEQYGNGSSVSTFFYFGASNAFFADSICFVGASHATGNGGACRFGTNDGVALFRGTDGTSRMSLFVIGDDGGTNQGSSNLKANVDFAALNGRIDILADKFYMSRDRTLVRSNANPTTETELTVGRGVMDVNTAILGFQEHSNKVDWTSPPYNAQVYRGYCRAGLTVTNGGTFRVNSTLTLGYTADTNPEGSAQQYMTRGQITVYTNSFVMASNIVVDGGLNFVSTTPRVNNITLNQGGTLIVTNTIGAAPGLPLDNLYIGQGGILSLFVSPGKTNVFVNNLESSGSTPGVIKVLSLPAFPIYPTNVAVISYKTASPFLVADLSAVGGSVRGFVMNNTDDGTIDLFLTTNAAQALTWKGNINGNWNFSTKNWVTTTGGFPTNFTLGDSVTFDDSASVTDVSITEAVTPSQTGDGVVISNITKAYTFASGGGNIIGTAKIVKRGAGNVIFKATEAGPFDIREGTVTNDAPGVLGNTTVFSNATLRCLATVNGSLTSTGTVTVAGSGAINGAVSLWGGYLVNDGTVATGTGKMTVGPGVMITNNEFATFTVSGGAWTLPNGSVLANFGTFNTGVLGIGAGRINNQGLIFGTGSFPDPDGGLKGTDGRLNTDLLGVLSPGLTPENSIGKLTAARVDFANNPGGSPFGYATLRIEVDWNNPQTNDIVRADLWNTIVGMFLVTNISGGGFTNGQQYTIFETSAPGLSNAVDTAGTCPLMWPPVPAPGLTWGLSDLRTWGSISVTNSPLIWNGNSGGNWDYVTANWKGGKTFGDNQGALLDDSASGTTTITLVTNLAPAGYAVNTNIVPDVSTNYTAYGPAMSPGLVISNGDAKPYILVGNGKITGLASLYKTGPGTLTMLTSNNYVGNTYLDDGTLVVTNGAGTVLGLGTTAGGSMQNSLVMNGGKEKYVGLTNVNQGNFVIIRPGGATFEVASSIHALNLNKNVVGEGALTKTGPGTLVLSQNSDTYAGGTTVSEGTVRMTAAAAGPGGINLASGTMLELTNSFTFTNAINVPSGSTTLRVSGNATNVSGGVWTGNGNVAINSTGAVQLVLNADISGFGGTMSLGTGTTRLRFNNATNKNDCLGSTTASFDLGTGSGTLNNYNGGGAIYDLGALVGGPGTVLYGRSSTNVVPPAGTTYRIGASGSSTVFDGQINNGLDTVSVIKVGAGKLVLNGANGFTGSLTVSNGTLGGSGSIGGNLIVRPAATLAPGASIGTFTVGGAATLGGPVVLELDESGAGLPYDSLSVAGTITASGALLVTNVGPNLYNYSTYALFNKAVSGFSSVTLPANDNTGPKAYVWRNDLAVDGTITLTSGGRVSPEPVPINYSRSSDGTLTLSWPANHIGWDLQSNAVSVVDTGAWHTVSGSTTTNVITISPDPSRTNVFYRMHYLVP